MTVLVCQQLCCPVTGTRLREIAAVPQRLDPQECSVQGDREQNQLDRHQCRDLTTGRGGRVAGQDKSQSCKGYDDAEVSSCSAKIVALFPVTQSAKEQRDTKHAVEYDHENSKQCVTGECRVVFTSQHDR